MKSLVEIVLIEYAVLKLLRAVKVSSGRKKERKKNDVPYART